MNKNDVPYIYPRTITNWVNHIALNYLDSPALSFVDEEPITYSEYFMASYLFAKQLDAAKVSKKAHVMILSQGSPWWCIAYLGVVGSGRVVVPVLPDFPASDVANIIKQSKSDLVVVSSKLHSKFVESKKKISAFCIEGFAEIKGKSSKFEVKEIADLKKELESKNKKNKLLESALKYFSSKKIDEEDLMSIIYTSGTSGMSKGVMLSNKNIISNANASNTVPPNVYKVNSLSILPLSHVYECTLGFLTTMTRGFHIHFLKRNLSPAVLMPALQKVKPVLMMSVPLLIEKVYRKNILPQINSKFITRNLYKFPPMRKILNRIAGKKLYKTFGGAMQFFGIGGAGLDPQVEQFLREAKFPYAMGYGLTESSPLCAGSRFQKSRYRSTGHFLPDIELKIDSPNESGEGEVLVKGPNVMLGYYNDSKKTAAAIDENGYFHTGDLGYVKDGYLYISGRCKNMILGSNGENIYPEAIESMLNEFDIIEESLVFQDDEKNLVAKIQLNADQIKKNFPDSKIDENDGENTKISESLQNYLLSIKEKLNKRLSKFSQVKFLIRQSSPFIKTPTNKIKRFLHDKINKKDDENKI